MHSARLFAAPDRAVVHVGLNFFLYENLTAESHEQTDDPSTISGSDFAQEAFSILHE